MNHTKKTIDLLGAACKFAAEKHRTQVRKNVRNTPYFSHPAHAALLVQQAGVTDRNVIVACLLHDTVEDTNTTYQELVDNFGPKIADIVMECTDDKSLQKVERKKLQIIHVKTASTEAKLVKLADKYSNLSDLLTNPPTTWSKEVIDGYWNWAYAVVNQMRGANDVFDALFDELFANANVSGDNLDEKLECYYQIIAKPEIYA
jgi:(p)ppGpp synthase/HD superfamily hydrolase